MNTDNRQQFQREVVRGDERGEVTIEVVCHGDDYTVTVTGPFGALTGTEGNAFLALREVRQQLEPDGWRLVLHGARKDTHAVGSMTSGLEVDLLVPRGTELAGPHALDDALNGEVRPIDQGQPWCQFNTFDPCHVDLLGTVEEQAENFTRFYPHLRPLGQERTT